MQVSLSSFIETFESQFEEEKPGSIHSETLFKELEEWNSMHALMVLAAIDAEYGVTLSAEELGASKTVTDLFNLIQNKVRI